MAGLLILSKQLNVYSGVEIKIYEIFYRVCFRKANLTVEALQVEDVEMEFCEDFKADWRVDMDQSNKRMCLRIIRHNEL